MAMTLITTNEETGATASSFTSTIDSTYKVYIFKFHQVGPATDDANFTFNGSIDAGSNYNVAKTTNFLDAYHYEDGSSQAVEQVAANDLANSTAFQTLTRCNGNDADAAVAGELWLFNPSNTTYEKHFYSTTNHQEPRDWSVNAFVSGYLRTTSAIDAIQFKMSSGNFDGIIRMYGIAVS